MHLAMESFMLGVPDDTNRVAMVRLLIAAGARCDARDGDTKTPAAAELGAAAGASEEALALLA